MHYVFSAEAAIALRQRLNETVDQLETLRKEHQELEVKFEGQFKELTIAKSDRESTPMMGVIHSTYHTINSHSRQQRST